MMFSTSRSVLLLVSSAHLTIGYSTLEPRAACNKNYATCNPKGASTQDEPPIGSALSPFYVDIVNTVDSSKNDKRDVQESKDVLLTRASGGSLCCEYRLGVAFRRSTLILNTGADGTQCLLLQDFNLPFCYVSVDQGPDLVGAYIMLG